MFIPNTVYVLSPSFLFARWQSASSRMPISLIREVAKNFEIFEISVAKGVINQENDHLKNHSNILNQY